ncbi:MAG TPA: hypothetical protein VLG40_04895 [Candidatus Saccharimonas sp.]|nr:hypothetical protein [Candidatus Saccharimonas sp.]
MNALMLVAVIAIALFAAAYITRRRFGVLGLALAAGSVLSVNAAPMLTPFLLQHGITMTRLPLDSVVVVILTIAPAAIFLFTGPAYNKMILRVLGAAGFALLALTLCVDTLQTIFAAGNNGQVTFLQQLHENQNIIIIVGIVAAIADAMLAGKPKSKERKKAKD